MSLQGDTELRDLVSQTLENAGVLAKIRAELRANVFFILEEHEAFKGRNLSYTNKPLRDYLTTHEGAIVVNLIREFLDYFGLEFTASVFEPETQAGKCYEFYGRNKLAQDLKLNPGKKSPLISQVLQGSVIGSSTVPIQKDELEQKCVNREKEPKKNLDINNFISKTDLSNSHTNGLVKNIQNSIKDISNSESRLHTNTTPNLNHTKKQDLKLDLHQINLKPSGSSLSSLGGLPPLGFSQNNQPKSTNNKSTKQVSSDIKALLDFGSDSPEHNYEEDFNPSGSDKTSKGTNRSPSVSGSEVEEEVSVGVDDQTSDLSGSNASGKAANLL